MKILRAATAKGVGVFHDDQHLIDAFARQSIDLQFLPWQDIGPGSPVLVRTPWDYTDDRPGFAQWLARLEVAETTCVNPIDLMRWNLDKRYLLDLEARGHAIVPTHVLPEYDEVAVRQVMDRNGWPEAIAKPVVGAGAEGLVRIDAEGFHPLLAHGNTWLDNVSPIPTGACIVQPLLRGIGTGEWSLFYFGGQYSHAVLKRPADGDIRVQEEHGGMTHAAEPPAIVREAAEAIMADVPDAVYARVDGVIEDGRFLLMELEMVEPELYFRFAPDAVDRFAYAVKEALWT